MEWQCSGLIDIMTHGVAVFRFDWHNDTRSGSIQIRVALWHTEWQCSHLIGTIAHGVAVFRFDWQNDTWSGSVQI